MYKSAILDFARLSRRGQIWAHPTLFFIQWFILKDHTSFSFRALDTWRNEGSVARRLLTVMNTIVPSRMLIDRNNSIMH
ncbi:hypothetical protein Y032_0150g2787 [Ancylostoma ceylanicum]|uniref:Uncharacterized protein n=1 Tax=Ancylostoma ceylanicum TaxID=53326 RepID=A0A016T1I0_9BILA|nr:hypothetical protein Y032_0150g2787 [Ancylostoma ceylanicum]